MNSTVSSPLPPRISSMYENNNDDDDDDNDKEALVEFSDPFSKDNELQEVEEEEEEEEEHSNKYNDGGGGGGSGSGSGGSGSIRNITTMMDKADVLLLDKLAESRILENSNKTVVELHSIELQSNSNNIPVIAIKNHIESVNSANVNSNNSDSVNVNNNSGGSGNDGAVTRKYINEDTSNPNWFNHHKHIFILNNSGKPIYSRYGDEQNLSPFMASLTAMVSFVADMKDTLRFIVAGNHKFVFLVKGPIILVSVSRTQEPVNQLLQQLNYMHSQIYAMLTSGVNQIFERRPTFDIRGLLGGADKFWDNMISLMDHDASFLLNSVHCLRMDGVVRASIGSILQSSSAKDLLFGVLMTRYQLITMVRPKKFSLQASDIHLIANFINSSTSFRTSVSWTPLCLPKFNDQGFLHSYVCYIAPEVCLLLISTKADTFYELATCKNNIVQGLTKAGHLEQISRALEVNYFYRVSEIGISSLLHFLYKSKAQLQFTCPKLEAPYSDRHQQKRLFRLYQYVHSRMHRFKKSHKVYYQVTQCETVVGWYTSGFELYATFGPLESKSSCITACNDILMWIKNQESSLFVLNFPIW